MSLGLNDYVVVYEIQVTADTPKEAAETVFDWIKSEKSLLPVFEVINELTGEQHTIDLSEIGGASNDQDN